MSGLVLSPGDWIAIGIGAMASFRWCVDLIGRWLSRNTEEAKADAAGLSLLRHDFDIHVAQDDVKFGWIKDTLERMERQLTQMQSQIRFVAIGGNDHIQEIPSRKMAP